ncbi:MAG: type II toxin-antitoxin system VapC family toxin [Mycobacterium sp.]
MILVDSIIPMYLVGAAQPSQARRATSSGVTDAEVLQEICHRYLAINKREAIQPAFDAILGVVDDVLAIERTDVEHAKDTVLRYQSLSARDALHLAVMARHDITQLMSFDRGFDVYPGIERLA